MLFKDEIGKTFANDFCSQMLKWVLKWSLIKIDFDRKYVGNNADYQVCKISVVQLDEFYENDMCVLLYGSSKCSIIYILR